MENGGITKIHHVDYKTEVVLGIYPGLFIKDGSFFGATRVIVASEGLF